MRSAETNPTIVPAPVQEAHAPLRTRAAGSMSTQGCTASAATEAPVLRPVENTGGRFPDRHAGHRSCPNWSAVQRYRGHTTAGTLHALLPSDLVSAFARILP